MTDKDAECRRHPRQPCDRTFEGNFPKAPVDVFRCHAVNASEGGLMLETDQALEVAQKIELSLRSRDQRRSVVAEAEVEVAVVAEAETEDVASNNQP